MEINGVIEQIIYKSSPVEKRVVVIKENDKNRWCVEFRKNLINAIAVLREGDIVKVEAFNDARIDKHENHYNNVIAESIERL